MKLLLYCTKAQPYLEFKQIPRTLMEIDNSFEGYRCSWKRTEDDPDFQINGKIVAECDFEVEEINHYIHHEPEVDVGITVLPEFECSAYETETLGHFELLEKSCMKDYTLPNVKVQNELDDYLHGKKGYAIYIKNLHIFDKPRELDFYSSNFDYFKKVEKAPQNMMEVWEDQESPRVLISIRPEWLCKILNGEKTIEVRKKVLKEMLKND